MCFDFSFRLLFKKRLLTTLGTDVSYAPAALALAALFIPASDALAQAAIERNMPPIPPASVTALPVVPPVTASDDPTPLGVNLKAIVLLGNADPIVPTQNLVDVSTEKLAQLNTSDARVALQKFIGQPLSRKLISEIHAEIARQSRNVGRPFISMSTPPQEVTSGVLQVRVSEFNAGRVVVSNAKPEQAKWVSERIRVTPGQPVNSDRLAEDLDWLNRNPFSDASALFAPASAAGLTDLDVSMTSGKPYRLYGGYSNSGSKSTGMDRYYLGGLLALPFLEGAYMSYQLTGSNDFWANSDRALGAKPRYMSQGLRAYIPTLPRQAIEFSYSDADTFQSTLTDFDVLQQTTEATLSYRSALSNFGLSSTSGDVLVGVEGKRQRQKVLFGSATALDRSADLVQLVTGWSKGIKASDRQGTVSVNLHVSPGGLGASSDEQLSAISNGRVSSGKYSYATLDLEGSQRISTNLAIASRFSAQYTGDVLPLSAQIGLGADSLVRGYDSEDGSFDAGVVWRNELRFAPIPVFWRSGQYQDVLSPFIFLDAGYGYDQFLDTHASVASIGFGATYEIGRTVSIALGFARALKDGPRTRSGEQSINTRINFSY